MAIKHKIKFNTEVVNGLCPECNQETVLVSIVPEFYRCSLCGNDLKQHVNGLCPECNQETVLVSIVPEFYRCTLCGNDLKQHVNGKISYIPVIALSEKEKHELALKDG